MIQTATDILRAVMTDTDGDSIPDTDDDDPGDIFQVENQ